MRECLGKLPLSLQTAYDEQIRSQDGSGGEVAERAIKWVMCSRSPLAIDELLGAVCQDPDGKSVAAPIDIDADFVLEACRNLLLIDPNMDRWRGKRKGQSTRQQFVSLYSYNCVAHSMACPEGAGRPLDREKGTCTLLLFGI
jgi:hypothetical protein